MATAAPGLDQPELQRRVFWVKAQAHDVNRLVNEGDRNLNPGQVMQAHGARGGGGTLLAANFVMVGQSPQLDAVGLGPGRQCLGR